MTRGGRFVSPRLAVERANAAIWRLFRPVRGDVAPVLTLPAALIAGGAILAAIMLFPLDERISLAMANEPDGVRVFLSYATDAVLVRWYLYPAAGLVIALLFLAAGEEARSERVRLHAAAAHATYLFSSVALAGIVTSVLKIAFGRARPALLDDYGPMAFQLVRFGNEYASFPSGHATTAGAVTAVAMVWFPSIRLPLLAAGLCLALSRIVVEAHFPSDVAAGFAIGLLTAIFLARWLAARRLIYRFRHAGRGWSGLLPVRSGALGA